MLQFKCHVTTHLSSRPSDLKQNGMRTVTIFKNRFQYFFAWYDRLHCDCLAQKTTFWLVEILWQLIRSFYSMVFEANTRNKTEHNMWKVMEMCATKWCLFLCTILFEVTWAFGKMWIPKSHGNILQGGAASFCALALKKYDGSSALPYQTERHVFEDPSWK